MDFVRCMSARWRVLVAIAFMCILNRASLREKVPLYLGWVCPMQAGKHLEPCWRLSPLPWNLAKIFYAYIKYRSSRQYRRQQNVSLIHLNLALSLDGNDSPDGLCNCGLFSVDTPNAGLFAQVNDDHPPGFSTRSFRACDTTPLLDPICDSCTFFGNWVERWTGLNEKISLVCSGDLCCP